jgi:uncharacterized protein with von Willebrand factor type A (vWA) domain
VRDRVLDFIDQLRAAGVAASTAETLDAMQAAKVVGIERDVLRASLAATLVKDEADRPTFDALFDRFFSAPERKRSKSERRQPTGEGPGHGGDQPSPRGLLSRESHPDASGRKEGEEHSHERQARKMVRRRRLLETPFEEMKPREVDEATELLEELSRRLCAHVSRRRQRASRGRLDFRRTIRASLGTGGVPLRPAFRERRKGKPDLIALCDLSYSTATAADFCLALLAPAAKLFRRVRLLAYVDTPVEVSFERGHVVPHRALDLAARSDFGRVLVQLWKDWEVSFTRNTVVLILGDARNNRRPPRADILGRIHTRARRVIWLNPETRTRWNTGDSVLASYARHCDVVLGTGSVRELAAALRSQL